ncbi:MAG TPA: glycosyltransferase [Microthrixaceae bacterium]|nr:glycosyltransferase [Microthrixaceae bacterium]
MTTLPFVRVIVLNWNAAWLTTRCVRSIQRTDYPSDRFEIVVVDNASIDGSLARLRHDLDGVRFVANDHNLGFAEGNNRALRDLEGCDAVALVNNDAVVEPGWLYPLVAALDDPTVGAVAPKMLLEAPFTPVRLSGAGIVERVTVDGVDVTRRCVYDGVVERAHETVPLGLVRSFDGSATVHVPVGSEPADIVVSFDDDRHLAVRSGPHGDRRINSLGTALTPWIEGFERWFGERDRPHLAPHEVWGFSGGGVLLRAAMLREVGVFDPRFFAYYEDTDLAWRARRHGWRTMCSPESVVHHLHGGSAGPEAQGFFFLNYRNWLLTAARNASPRQALAAAAVARRLSWGPFRRNVFGRIRRWQRPETAISIAWARVFAGVAAALPSAIASRVTRRRVGSVPTDTVRSLLMPATPPRPPRPRAGGPLLCYVDVTETLRSGWRAGIQRVVCELVKALPNARPDIELVPVCWSKVHSAFRRLDADEYASLLEPTTAQQPAGPPPPPTAARKALALAMHRSGAAPVVHSFRRRRELATVPQHHRHLLLDRFEPGTVFFDLDATWNPTTQPRSDLLPQLVASGVHVAVLQHDLIPHTHPNWFIPQMVDVFMAHVDAHLDAGSAFLCNSEHTRSDLLEYAAGRGAVPTASVFRLGDTPLVSATPPEPANDAPAGAGPYFLTVGTVEPRKGHATILDAFDKVRADHPDAKLVVVGRAGWNNSGVVERLTERPQGVVWRSDVSDAELDRLYRGAVVVIVASVTEGFGLPVVEALQRGVPVLSSRGGALPEAGGDLVEYFDTGSSDQLHALMERHLTDADHHAARVGIVGEFQPNAWSDAAAAVGQVLRSLGDE